MVKWEKVPPRHKGQGKLCVFTKKYLLQEFLDSAKNQKLLISREQSVPKASRSQIKPR